MNRNPKQRLGTRNDFPGIYRARVEFRADPLRIGRVKVRVPQLHGIPGLTDEFIEVQALPWAMPANSSTSGFDMGDFRVPVVGSFVWVQFEAGDREKVRYFSGVYGTGSKTSHKYGSLDGENPEPDSVPAGSWDSPVGESEVPSDVFDGKSEDDHEPTRDVLYKSMKGHTVVTEEEDEKESMSFIDRAGQIFRFICPIKSDENRTGDNSFQRGTRNSIKGDQLDYEEQSFMSKAVVILKDLAGQIVRTVSEYGKEKVEIASRDKKEKRQSVLQLRSGESTIDYLLICEDKEKDNKIYIKADATNLKLQLVVVEGGTEKSKIELTSTKILTVSGSIEEQAQGSIKSLAGGSMVSHSSGSMDIGTDSSLGIYSGGTSIISSGGNLNMFGSVINENTGSGPSYGKDKKSYSPPSDSTSWEDERDEDFVEE